MESLQNQILALDCDQSRQSFLPILKLFATGSKHDPGHSANNTFERLIRSKYFR